MTVSFFVPGDPIPKGSMKAFVVGGRARLTNNDERTKPWQMAVAMYARQNWSNLPSEAAFSIQACFFLRRPRSHYTGTGKLKNGAPPFPTMKKADTDKLFRLVGDALTGIVYFDDSQVIDIQATKRYADVAGAQVTCKVIEPERIKP